MVTPTTIPVPTEPITDPRTGQMTRSWRLFFTTLFNLVGAGGNTITIPDTQLAPAPVDPSNELSALQQEIGTLPVYEVVALPGDVSPASLPPAVPFDWLSPPPVTPIFPDDLAPPRGNVVTPVDQGGTGVMDLDSGYLMKGGNPVGASVAYDDGTNIGIGTASPAQKLDVNGTAKALSVMPDNTPSSKWGLDFAPSTSASTYITIANNGTYDLAAGSGMLFIWENAGNGVAQIACFYGATAIVWQSYALYTITIGTASSINVYYNAGTDTYRIQNLTGSSVNLFLGTMRFRTAS